MPVGAIVGAGVLGAGASVASGVIGANASKSAANIQAQAQLAALQQQKQMFGAIQGELQPFVDVGKGAIPTVQNLLGLGGSGAPDAAAMQAALEQTPGYQFALDQGLKSVQSAQASQGLARSGSAIKGAEQYAEGLASNTYQQQLQNYMKLLSGGQDAAGTLAQAGLQSQQQANALQVGAGASKAAGQLGVAQSINSAIGGFASGIGNNALLLGLPNPGLYGISTQTENGKTSVTPYNAFNRPGGLFG